MGDKNSGRRSADYYFLQWVAGQSLTGDMDLVVVSNGSTRKGSRCHCSLPGSRIWIHCLKEPVTLAFRGRYIICYYCSSTRGHNGWLCCRADLHILIKSSCRARRVSWRGAAVVLRYGCVRDARMCPFMCSKREWMPTGSTLYSHLDFSSFCFLIWSLKSHRLHRSLVTTHQFNSIFTYFLYICVEHSDVFPFDYVSLVCKYVGEVIINIAISSSFLAVFLTFTGYTQI